MPEEKKQDSLFLRLIRMLYKLKIIGEENIPKEGACVIAVNHSARFIDGLTFFVAMKNRPDAITFGAMGMPSERRIGRAIRRRRKKGDGDERPRLIAYKARGFSGTELLKALSLLRDGRPIVVAAEGEVAWDGQLIEPLALGAVWMALRAHVPVVPIVLIGGYDIHPRWRNRPKLTGRTTVRVGEPFYVRDQPVTRLDEETINQANKMIYEKMKSLIDQGHA
jgi:1-acyl-sn-glycerol-3-phosphate acyltransferase